VTASPELIACRCAAPAFVSGLSALAWHGISSIAPVRIQCATLRGSGVWPGEVEVEQIHVPLDLFGGYREEEDPCSGESFPVATPERALVDYLWHCEETGERPELSVLDLDLLDAREVLRWARPAGVDVAAHLPRDMGGLHAEPLRLFARRLGAALGENEM
jgi:predicted transcriptional regulator of viral defense system